MKLSTILFDLDDTLYPPSNGIWSMIREKINEFMVINLDYSQADARTAQQSFFHQYGTTLRGLQTEFNIDPVKYLKFVHNIPVNEFIQPNLELKSVLAAIPTRKIIFTNSDRWHTNRVLEALDISEYFDEIIDVLDMQPFCKPMLGAFESAFDKLRISDPAECLIVDDNMRNISTAQSIGMRTIWVNHQPDRENLHHYQIQRIEEIGKAIHNIYSKEE
ncbi:MAG: pyrimidine 5'-nucleotidase [Anaerolineaceae bacterium]